MTAYQLWKDERGNLYVPSCEHCGEMMRSSPTYDGQGPNCTRKRCRKSRGAKPVPGCLMSPGWEHWTGESCERERLSQKEEPPNASAKALP